MRGFVGIGQSNKAEEAVFEATNGLKNADLLVVIAPHYMAEKAADILHDKYPNIPMIGTTGASISKGTTDGSRLTVIAFAGVEVSLGLIENVNKTPINAIPEFEAKLAEFEPGEDNSVCLEFITDSEEKVLSTLQASLAEYNLPLAGGSADLTPLGDKKLVIMNGKVYHNSCVYAFVKNLAGRILVCKENIYERGSEKPHFATLVDTRTKSLFQIDERPATEVYTEETGCERENIVSNMIYAPLGRALGTDTILSASTSVDMNGVIFNGRSFYEHDSIYIMKLGDYKTIHIETLENIGASLNKVSFCLGFDSPARLELFAKESYQKSYIKSLYALGSFAAFVGASQQYNKHHTNQTMVYVVFE